MISNKVVLQLDFPLLNHWYVFTLVLMIIMVLFQSLIAKRAIAVGDPIPSCSAHCPEIDCWRRCGTEVGKLFHYLECEVTNGDVWSAAAFLTPDVGFLETDC